MLATTDGRDRTLKAAGGAARLLALTVLAADVAFAAPSSAAARERALAVARATDDARTAMRSFRFVEPLRHAARIATAALAGSPPATGAQAADAAVRAGQAAHGVLNTVGFAAALLAPHLALPPGWKRWERMAMTTALLGLLAQDAAKWRCAIAAASPPQPGAACRRAGAACDEGGDGQVCAALRVLRTREGRRLAALTLAHACDLQVEAQWVPGVVLPPAYAAAMTLLSGVASTYAML